MKSEVDYFVKWVDLSHRPLKTTECKVVDFRTKNAGATYQIGHCNVVTLKRS